MVPGVSGERTARTTASRPRLDLGQTVARSWMERLELSGRSLLEPTGMRPGSSQRLPQRRVPLGYDLPTTAHDAERLRGGRVRLLEEVPLVLPVGHVDPHVVWSPSGIPGDATVKRRTR